MPKRRFQKIVFVRDGFPYKGGSSTFLYLLFESLKDRLPRAEYWNMVKPEEWELGKRLYGDAWQNPKKMDRVRTLLLNGRKTRGALSTLLQRAKPDRIISKSRPMTVFLKKERPDLWVEHVTSTSGQIKESIARGALRSLEEALSRARRGLHIAQCCPEEKDAVRLADRIHFHSDSVRFWYWYFYPEYRHKMDETVYWDYPILKKYFKGHKKPKSWRKRSFDVLLAATDWSRTEKNFSLLKRISKKLLQKRKRVVVVGFCPERLPEGIMHFPVVSQDELYYLMQDARVFVAPSRYDEAPNVIFEASLAGCNIVCSSNCGNFRMAAPELRAVLTGTDFIRKILKGLHRPLPGETHLFEQHDLSDLIFNSMR